VSTRLCSKSSAKLSDMIDKTQTSRRSPPLFDESNQGLVKLKDRNT